MEKVTLKRDGARALRFTGELLAKASSSDSTAAGRNYSGETGRWQVLRLYKTQGGRYVGERINRSAWQGERDEFDARVCGSIEKVFDFFGHDWLARDLYEAAGIEAVEDIE